MDVQEHVRSRERTPERKYQELSAPRPRGGRLVIFEFCAARTEGSDRSYKSFF
jgi:hypothetical protein